VVRDPPSAHGVVLRLAGLPCGRRVLVGLLPEDASGDLLPCFAARAGEGEEDVKVSLRIRFRLTNCADHIRCPPVHPVGALRSRRREHDAAEQVGADECDLLCDEAPDREPEQIHLLEAHCCDERNRVVSHRLDRVRCHAGRAADAAVVERDDAPSGGEVVD
jgi:hypothetical protein